MVRARNYQGDDTEGFCGTALLEIKDVLNSIKSNAGSVLWGHGCLLGTLESNGAFFM